MVRIRVALCATLLAGGCGGREEMKAIYQVELPLLEGGVESVLQLRIHNNDPDVNARDNSVDLCLLRLDTPIRVATMAFEKDAYDAYHLSISALDSALNESVLRSITLAALPTTQLGGITVFETALLSAIDAEPYALRFCRPEPAGLRCQSLIGRELAYWTMTPDDRECRPPPICSATSDLGLTTRQLACLDVAGASVCEQVRSATPEKLVRCLAPLDRAPVDEVDVEVDDVSLREGCEVIDRTLRGGLEPVEELASRCVPDVAPPLGDALAQLCSAVDTAVGSATMTTTTLIETTTRVCAESGQVYDFVARCCSALVPDAEPPRDAGVDAPMPPPDAAPPDGPSACAPSCPVGQLCCPSGQQCCNATQYPGCCVP